MPEFKCSRQLLYKDPENGASLDFQRGSIFSAPKGFQTSDGLFQLIRTPTVKNS